MWDYRYSSLPKGNILELLHDFVNQFLSGGYNGVFLQSRVHNLASLFLFIFYSFVTSTYSHGLILGLSVLMQSIRVDIEKEHHGIQSSDVVVFFHLAHFATAFQCHKFSILKVK